MNCTTRLPSKPVRTMLWFAACGALWAVAPIAQADPAADKQAQAVRDHLLKAIESAQGAGFQISRVTGSAILYTLVEVDGPPGRPICGPRGNVSLLPDGGLTGVNETAIKNTYAAIKLMVESAKKNPPVAVRIEVDSKRSVCSALPDNKLPNPAPGQAGAPAPPVKK